MFSRAGRAGKNNSGPTNTWSKDHEKQNSKNKNNKIRKWCPSSRPQENSRRANTVRKQSHGFSVAYFKFWIYMLSAVCIYPGCGRTSWSFKYAPWTMLPGFSPASVDSEFFSGQLAIRSIKVTSSSKEEASFLIACGTWDKYVPFPGGSFKGLWKAGSC